jgi:tRNA A37 N6-isopentenylltransferase MiaA
MNYFFFDKMSYTILVGGSGLYVDAIPKGLIDFPEYVAVRADILIMKKLGVG